jgi:uroporphyrinogen decarboxylase
VLANARTIADLGAYSWPDPAWWDASEIGLARARDPDRALVLFIGWWLGFPLFCQACNLFGMEEALVKMISEPALFDAYVRRQSEFVLALMERCLRPAKGVADICWLADDVATQRSLIMSPEMWRRYFKEPTRRQADLAHKYGLFTLFHSCGAVREILPDLIDIGVDGLLTFQTSADGMDAASIARDFGGKMVFYGGIDVQQTLSFGTEAEVRREVRTLIDLFSDCGGFILSNAHNIQSIKPANVVAMLTEARRYSPREGRATPGV